MKEPQAPLLKLGDKMQVAGRPGVVSGFSHDLVYVKVDGRDIPVDRKAVEACVLERSEG